MDDFGGIWERDYGLGRRNRSSSGRTNYDSTRFSDSFSRGKRQNEVLNKGRNYSSPAKYSSNMGSSTYSYNMYSEIFSSNVHSTIPVFEDVFRVPRPRTKVSDIRENEIFRGIPSSLRKNSRVTYEDIFADDVSSGPFLFSDVAGSRLTVASSRTASSSGTPRRDSAESPTMEVRNGNHHAAAFKVQRLSKKAPEENGQDKEPRQELNTNCLTKQEELNMDGLTKQQQLNLDGLVKKEDLILDGLPRQEQLNSTQQDQEELNSKSLPEEQNSLPKQEFNSESLPKQELNSNIQELKCEGSVKQELNASVNHEGLAKQDLNSTLPSESPAVETREWLSVGEVNLTTKPSEIPPPVRLPPSRSASAEIWFETSEADSGPPPSRVPPPVETSVSELLERNIKGRSQHAEMSIREKVLDWQKHNLKEELMMKSSRSETLIRAPKKRAEVERIEAEVEHLIAEQARARAERAKVDARQGRSHAQGLKVNDAKGSKGSDRTEGGHGKGSEVGHAKGTEVNGLVQGDEKGEQGEKGEKVADAVLETDGGDATGLGVEQNGHATVFDVKQGGHATSVDVEGSKDEKGDKGENVGTEEGGKDEKGDKGENVVTEEGGKDEKGDKGENMVTESTNNDDGDGQGGNSTSSRDLPASETQAPEDADAVREEEHPKSETESTISMATISSEEAVTNGKLKEETAPETPERLDEVHPRHDGNKSSETEIPEDAMEFAWKELDVTKKQEEDQGDARRIEERTLVARITAEVRERAALEAKARAESASRIAEQRRTKPRLKEQHQEYVAKELEDSRESSKNLRRAKLSLREQLERERLTRIENERVQQQQCQTKAQRDGKQRRIGIEMGRGEIVKAEGEAKGDKTETSVEKITSEARERAEREKAERERLERLDRARERERERLERLEKERERERREQEREREIEREKDRVGLEEKAARERAAAEEAARVKMERAAVERATAEARARAFERAAVAASSNDSSRPTSVPKQRFGNSASMPSNGAQPSENGGIRRATSSTNLETDRYSSASSSNNRDFEQEFLQELKGETPERRKARLERFQRTQNRAAQALAQKNQRDLEMQSEQAERQRLSERLDGEIKRWSVGKDGNIRALLSTLQYVLWPDSGWKQLTLTELITPAAVKKAYRRATLCVHPDKMQQKHASVQQKYIAEKVFHILQVAWNRFNSQAAL